MPHYNPLDFLKSCFNKIFASEQQYNSVELDPEALFDKPAENLVSTQRVLRDFTGLILSPENYRRISAAGSLTIFSAVFNYLPPYFMSQAIAAIRERQDSEEEASWTNNYEVLMTAACVTFAVSQLIPNLRSYITNPIASNNNQKLINMIVSNLVKNKSLEYHNEVPFGDHMIMIQKGFSVTDSGTPILETIMPTIIEISMAATALTSIYGMTVGLNVLIMLAAFTAYSIKTTEPVIALNKEILDKNNVAFEKLCKTIKNYKVEHDFNKEEYELGQVNATVKALFDAIVKAQNVSVGINNGHVLIARAFMLSGCLLATTRDPDKLLVLFTYLNQLGALLPNFGSAVNRLAAAYPDIRFVFTELAKKSEVMDENPDLPISVRGGHDIEFKNVLFAYPKKPNIHTLDGLNIKFESGKTYALVSQSGAGKTTIFNLLYRYYNPRSGEITINGQEISSVGLSSLRASIGMLGQTPCLFSGTLRYNIKYGAKNSDTVTDEYIMQVADQLSLRDFIRGFEKELDHEVGEDGKFLSGGQQQRVAILRGMMKECNIRLLDEVTASLDAKTADEVLSKVIQQGKQQNITTIMISHNLSEVSKHADKILVLGDGKVVAIGTHEDLLNQCELYKTLWDKQHEPDNPAKAGLSLKA